jgi:hypothetical protein
MVMQYCAYPNDGVECKCVGDPMGAGNFTCNYTTPPPSPCPGDVPNAGTACGSASMVCNYMCSGTFNTESVLAQCVSGLWEWSISTSGCAGG